MYINSNSSLFTKLRFTFGFSFDCGIEYIAIFFNVILCANLFLLPYFFFVCLWTATYNTICFIIKFPCRKKVAYTFFFISKFCFIYGTNEIILKIKMQTSCLFTLRFIFFFLQINFPSFFHLTYFFAFNLFFFSSLFQFFFSLFQFFSVYFNLVFIFFCNLSLSL